MIDGVSRRGGLAGLPHRVILSTAGQILPRKRFKVEKPTWPRGRDSFYIKKIKNSLTEQSTAFGKPETLLL